MSSMFWNQTQISDVIFYIPMKILADVFLVSGREIRELWNGWKYDLKHHGVEKGLTKPAFIKNFAQVEIILICSSSLKLF